MIALTVLWNEKYSDLMVNYLSILVWRCLPSELTSPVKWSPRAEGPTLCLISQGLHMAHKKPEYEYGFIPCLVIKKIASKSPVYIVDWRPAFTVTSQCLGIPLRSARVAPLFKWTVRILRSAVSLSDIIMGSVTLSMHSHDKTNEHILSYWCANNAIERCQSNCRK